MNPWARELHQHHAGILVARLLPQATPQQLHRRPGSAVDPLDERDQFHNPVRYVDNPPPQHECRNQPHYIDQNQQRNQPRAVNIRPRQQIGDGLQDRGKQVENELQHQRGDADGQHHQHAGDQGPLEMPRYPPQPPPGPRPRRRAAVSAGGRRRCHRVIHRAGFHRRSARGIPRKSAKPHCSSPSIPPAAAPPPPYFPATRRWI